MKNIKHKWYFESLNSGIFISKVLAAQKHSIKNNYLPYKVIFNINKINFI